MNKNLYIGEDHDLFFRLSENLIKLKFIFQKIFMFIMKIENLNFFDAKILLRLKCFNTKNTKIKRSLALIPFFVFSSIFIVLFLKT